MKLLNLLTGIVLSLAMIVAFCNVTYAAETISIDTVTIQNYEDEYGNIDDSLVSIVIEFTTTNAAEQITVLLTSENITEISTETVSKIIFMDQVAISDETIYTFNVEKSRIKAATGLDDIDGCTLYVKMGAKGVESMATTMVEYNDSTSVVMYGDVTGDGTIDIADAIKILRFDAGYDQLTNEQYVAAELTNDGMVDIADAIKILRYDAGYDTTIK